MIDNNCRNLSIAKQCDLLLNNPNPTGIRNAMIIVVTGCVLTMLFAHYFENNKC